MKANSYSTAVAGMYRIDKIEAALKKAVTFGEVRPASQFTKDSVDSNIVVLVDAKSDVPTFSHPLRIEDKIFIDGRGFIKLSRSTREYEVNQHFDFTLAIYRAGLEISKDEDEGFLNLYSSSEIPMYIFITWIAENLTQRLALDPEMQMKISVVAGFYYHNIHSKEQYLDDSVKEKMVIRIATKISQVTRIPVQTVLDISTDLDYMDNLEAFVSYVKATVKSSRMDELNIGTAVSFLANSTGWRGIQAREIAAVALEHAPTWHSMLALAVTDRSVGQSRLAKQLKRYRGRDSEETYVRRIMSVVYGKE